MGNWRKENADDPEDSIFANNPFLDDLLEWRHSPEGQQFAEIADSLCDLMDEMQLDAKQRNGSISISQLRTSRSNTPTSAETGSRST